MTNDSGIKEHYIEESKYYIVTISYRYVSRDLQLLYDGIDDLVLIAEMNYDNITFDTSK